MIKYKGFIDTAKVWARQSHCQSRHVGAVIFNRVTNQLLSIGYNGTPAGFIYNCDELFSLEYNNDNDNDRPCFQYYIHSKIRELMDPGCVLPEGWNEVSETEWKRLHHEFAELYEVHAEQNAIYNLIKSGTGVSNIEDLELYTTTEPCQQCAKAIAALGIKHVSYGEEYARSHDHVKQFFEKYGVLYDYIPAQRSACVC